MNSASMRVYYWRNKNCDSFGLERVLDAAHEGQPGIVSMKARLEQNLRFLVVAIKKCFRDIKRTKSKMVKVGWNSTPARYRQNQLITCHYSIDQLTPNATGRSFALDATFPIQNRN
ncbi:hypothetical protein EVAR_94914_1 [Eumeta japonica]|uniref:Uncharacterized protein n=1 Tax=Eumeta variegata TaxID=151549 RepID=A0A4C1Z2E4_EUMVA|nr:hypothetical protein EVAR_94914_1 [Eumeta japonica]